MSIGPVEYIAIAFPGNRFSGAIIPALQELVDSGTIKILDLILIRKEANGDINGLELADASPEEPTIPAMTSSIPRCASCPP